MTRQELYDMVWSRPITRVAKDFGISDVALGKQCKKYDIPKPPVGYWAKVSHGKKALKQRLPIGKRSADEIVYLEAVERIQTSVYAEEASREAEARREQIERLLKVPENLPSRCQPAVVDMRRALRELTPDIHGFVRTGNLYVKKLEFGKDSVNRVAKIVETIASAAKALGQQLIWAEGRFLWQIGDEPFELRIYELVDKQKHTPTATELKEQARREKWDQKIGREYSTTRKTYRTWDYLPSGRLALKLSDTNSRWGSPKIAKHWTEPKTGPALEAKLVDVFIWLAGAEVSARECRLELEAEVARQQDEAQQQIARQETQNRALKLQAFLHELTDTHEQFKKTTSLLAFMRSSRPDSAETPPIIDELKAYQSLLLHKLENSCSEDISGLTLQKGENLVLSLPMASAVSSKVDRSSDA
ncbi:hypothetical protein [Congregibacter litoralis]|uniref:Uncharacterized protein n=1 Tax=Congregibacter litoralis KT71 TaxID=314285 RepID=A4AD55_9GAMM|nr:hypothetical protein [Congregibacter litoralis]EAQ96108.1 hypothetical protein KT71_08630 [Congregibacter litoralis KT71]